jgi:hypothetical protein
VDVSAPVAQGGLVLFADAALRSRFEAAARRCFGPQLHWCCDVPTPLEPRVLDEAVCGLPHRPAAAIVLSPLAGAHGTPGGALGGAPVVAGVPLGIVAYEDEAQLQRWFGAIAAYRADESRVVVTAMQKPSYVAWALRLQNAFAPVAAPGRAELRLPATTTRDELAARLGDGFRLCLYAGHGRSRGWSGYRGLRWPHLAAVEARGVGGSVVSLSCSALRSDRVLSRPFGLEWIWSGRLCSFLGAVDVLRLRSLVRIAGFMLAASEARPATIGALVCAVDERVQGARDEELAADWRQFRLVGHPLQPI